MSRRDIRRMLTTPKKGLKDHPVAVPALMGAVLLVGVGLGVGIGLVATGPSKPPATIPAESLDRPARHEDVAAVAADDRFRPIAPMPLPRPGGAADDGYRPEGQEDPPPQVQEASVPLILPQPPVSPATPDTPAWRRFAVAAPRTAGQPMIAVVLDDMGVDKKRSVRTLALRAPLTLAFMTYAEDLEHETAAARQRGHELMLHVPMQPQGEAYDPGPDVLEVGLSSEEIRRRLNWGLDRFEGFVGVNNHMGSRFTADAAGMRVVMEELRRRGLLFLDSVTTDKSVAPEAARRAGVPFAARNVFIDNEQSVAAVKAQLAKVEAYARKHGAAIAIGHPHDATIEALSAWLPTLEAHGFVLVPLTAIVKRQQAAGEGNGT